MQIFTIVPDQRIIEIKCIRCRKSLMDSRNKFMIGFKFLHKGKSHRFILIDDQSMVCCDEEKAIVRLFDTAEEANKVRNAILSDVSINNENIKKYQMIPLL